MNKRTNSYSAGEPLKDSIARERAGGAGQKLYKSNAISGSRNKTKVSKKDVDSTRKPISALIHKTKKYLSEEIIQKTRVPVSFQKLKEPVFTGFRHMAQYFGLSKPLYGNGVKKPLLKEKKRSRQAPDIIDGETIAKLQHSISSRTPGTKTRNHRGEILGTIEQLTYDEEGKVQYVILNCAKFFGKKNRYFAIPAFSSFMELGRNKQIVMKLDKNELKLARGISAEKCPKLSLKFGPSVYELYNYKPRRTVGCR